MSDQNPSTGFPAILEADELYNTLMGSIEPDLTSENLAKTLASLEFDTWEQKDERIARYNAAFAEYDRRLTDHKNAWDKAYKAFSKASLKDLKAFLQVGEDQHMTDVEHELDNQV